jgi:hypothetical protein
MRQGILPGLAICALVGALPALTGCAARHPAISAADSRESIYVLRSIREPVAGASRDCLAATTGFEPYASDAAREFSFWSLRSDPADGRVTDARAAQVARLHGCFGPTEDRTRQNFFAEIELGSLSLRGRGECVAVLIDFPEPGLFSVRCQLILDGLPAPFTGGLLTTNTITSSARFGGDTEPSGYTQASIATIRLWRARAPR